MTIRIAGWSGPRNRSTALMRSFEARGDCRVTDEPLYAHYLARTGLPHPMREAVLASQSSSWEEVTEGLSGEVPEPLWYQKHMAHHWFPDLDRHWLRAMQHILWIRHPAAVIASYASKRTGPEGFTASELGLVQQHALWRWLIQEGIEVVVVDTDWLVRAPARRLPRVCDALGISYTPRMLSWGSGPRDTDGVWGRHWYGSVWASTGFAPGDSTALSDLPQGLLQSLLEPWEALQAVCLSATERSP